MNIIGRYILKEHVGPFLFASTALTSLMLLQYIAKKFGDLVGKGLPANVIAEFMALSVPFTVAMTMPMAVLVAVLYAFSRLAAENEITALKASGVSMRSVLAPVLLFGLVMSLVMIAFNDQVLPRANHRLAILQLDIFRTKPTFALREQVINTIKESQLYLRAGDIDEGTSEMTDVDIWDLSDPLRRRTIQADSGRLGVAKNGKDLDLTLFDGVMIEVPNKKPSEMTRLFFKRDQLRVKSVLGSYQESQSGTVSKGDREMSVCEMQTERARADLLMRQARYDVQRAEFDRAGRKGTPPVYPTLQLNSGIGGWYCGLLSLGALVSTRDAKAAIAQTPAPIAPSPDVARMGSYIPDEEGIRARIQEARFRMDDARRQAYRFDVEIHKKFSLAAACIVFVLVGAPIALRFPRGGVGLVIGVSFAIFGLYYVGLIGGETLANKALLPPWLAMWIANIVLLLLGLALVSRMGRESATTRGGDFTELMLTSRAKVFGWLRTFGVPVERRRR